MKRPSFQFYPGDWKQNSKLRRCSEAARGAWIDILCLLHDADEYGICRWPLDEVARAAGVPLKLAKELVSKDVLKGADKGCEPYIFTPRHAGKDGDPVVLVESSDKPCWYSSRFVRDEYIRLRRGQSTQFSAENQPPKTAPKPPIGGDIGARQGDGSSSSSSTSLNTNTPNPAKAGLPSDRKKSAVSLHTFLENCVKENVRPVRDYAALWEYVESTKLPEDFIALAWAEFGRRFLPGGTEENRKYKDWRKTFFNYVTGNYLKIWYIDSDGNYQLTTQGKQAEKFQNGTNQ